MSIFVGRSPFLSNYFNKFIDGRTHFRHVHDRSHRKRDTAKCFNQREVTRKRDRETGLSTIRYKISSINKLNIDNAANVTVLNIKLNCNHFETPWCDCSNDQSGKKV